MCGALSLRLAMSIFAQFKELCCRFRWASQYNGHLAHMFQDRVAVHATSGNPVARDLTRRRVLTLLTELRHRLWDPTNDSTSLVLLMDQLIDEVTPLGVTVTPGRVIKPAACPWCTHSHGGGDLTKPDLGSREQFRQGESAREELLGMIDVDHIALEQVTEYCSILGLAWASRRIHQCAQDAVASPRFEEGCYSEATLRFIDGWLRGLRDRHSDTRRVTLDDIRALIASRIGGTPMTFWGRFGVIVRDVLRAKQRQEQEIGCRRIDYQNHLKGPTPRDALLDEWVEEVLSHYMDQDRRLLRTYLRMRRSQEQRDAAIGETAKEHGVTWACVREVVKDFRERAFRRS